MTTTTWPTLVTRLREVQTEVQRVAPFRDIGLVPNPGASDEAIDRAEKRLGFALPPSYREFLTHHDGWPRFFDGATLLGTDALGSRRYDELCRAAFEAAETPVPDIGPPLKRRPPRMIPFAADAEATTLFAFDPNSRTETGECEVIAWINEVGVRSATFSEFLELLIELSESELAAHQTSRPSQAVLSQPVLSQSA
jgi:hypothetical protein